MCQIFVPLAQRRAIAQPGAMPSTTVERSASSMVQERLMRSPRQWVQQLGGPRVQADAGSSSSNGGRAGSSSGGGGSSSNSLQELLAPYSRWTRAASESSSLGKPLEKDSTESAAKEAKVDAAAQQVKQAKVDARKAERDREEALRNARTAEGRAERARKKAKAAEDLKAARVANLRQDDPVQAAVSSTWLRARESLDEIRSHISAAERDTIYLLAATALVTPAMNLVGLSPVLGFLFAGMLLGPSGLSFISDVETTTKLAELGVVFFLFEMGLELELERLKSVGRDAFSLGTAQFLLTGALLGAIAYFGAGMAASTSLVLGGGLALSSSAFVIQLLTEKGELASRFGRATFGILLFQDLAVVPLLVLTPLLGGSGAQLGAALRLAAVKSVAALSCIFFVGRVLLQRVYKVVASARDQTSFLAITLVTVLSMAGFTAAVGLSDTLGAFLAGVLLAETKYRYQIEADIAPFRGLLLGLFFITTGFSIDVGLAIAKWPLILGMAVGIHTVKTLMTALVCLAGRLKLSVAIRSGLLLSQGGEFAFVIFALAEQHGLLLPPQVKLLLTTVVLTMFLTPFLNDLGARIAASFERRTGKILLPSPDEAEAADYILICGFGRVGQAVAELLTTKLVRYKAFDMDPYRVAEARELGLPVFFGDATRPEVLTVFLREAKAEISGVVVALDQERDCTRCVRSLRRLYPTVDEMPIYVRATDEKSRRKFAASGAIALETGPQESALLLGGALLSGLGLPREEVLALIDEKRNKMYSTRMKDIFSDEDDVTRSKKRKLPLLRSTAEKAADKAAEQAAEMEKAETAAIDAAAVATATVTVDVAESQE
jgi:CPA2 family monovalent cation:H+ antiporter-2